MNNLVIDIGNSSTKFAVFKDRQLIYEESAKTYTIPHLASIIEKYQIGFSLVSSVNEDITELSDFLKTCTQYTQFSAQTRLPIQNHYQSPETLGLDRLAALMGARCIFPAKDVLVIDAGTCITYDLLNQQDQYFGGSISPGISMRLKALNAFTARLPLVDFEPDFQHLIGKNTSGSILSGVINGVLAEVQGFIQNYKQQYPQLAVLLCGGDANFLVTRLKNSIFAHTISHEAGLVLIGLNEVIHFQHDQ